MERAFEIVSGRPPGDLEHRESLTFASEHGLAAFCRVLFNSNGFLYLH
jgi:hypothetical protein